MWSKHQKIIAVCANLFCMINHQRCHGFSFHSKSFVTTPILNGHTNRQYIHSSTTHSFSKTHDNDSNTEAINNTDQEEQKSNDMFHQTDYRANIKEERRRFLSQMTSTGFLLTNTWMLQPKSVMAKTGQVKTSQYAGKTASTKAAANPKEAFQGLLKAREELQYANSKFIQKGDMEGLRSYLMNDATNISSFESYALSILASKLITYVWTVHCILFFK